MAESEKPDLPADGRVGTLPAQTESQVLRGTPSHLTGADKVK